MYKIKRATCKEGRRGREERKEEGETNSPAHKENGCGETSLTRACPGGEIRRGCPGGRLPEGSRSLSSI
jgi:hypothetical protein